MTDMDDYLARKRDQLGMGRADELTTIQAALDSWYPGQARAKSLNKGILQIVTPSSAVASELRMRQVELIIKLDQVDRIKIIIN
jgi:hypothetical protein